MKKVAAFLTAFVIFAVFVTGLHFYGEKQINDRTWQMSTWNNIYKYASRDAVVPNLDKNTILMFGSSEFNHGVKTKYYPKAVFRDQKFSPMIMGSAYSQCMTDAIALASLEPESRQRKVIIMLSPQWFNADGVKPEQFALRFSESNYVAMLKNSKLSYALRKKMADRTCTLLSSDEAMQKRAEKYEQVYLTGGGNAVDRAFCSLRQVFVGEKDRLCVMTAMKAAGLSSSGKKPVSGTEPDWNRLENRAEAYAERHSSGSSFYMYDKVFKKKIKHIMKQTKGKNRGRSYSVSPEYGDFRMFLDICRERNIKPLIIELPLNGYWYDYTGFPHRGRDIFYKNISSIAREYGARAVDLSKYEYTPYFMRDGVHFSSKGWVKIDECIYSFYKENNR